MKAVILLFFFLPYLWRNLTALNTFILKVKGDAHILPTYYRNICSFEFQYCSMSSMQRIPKGWEPSVMFHRQKCTYLWGSATGTTLPVPKTAMQHLVSGMQLPMTKFSQGFVVAAHYPVFLLLWGFMINIIVIPGWPSLKKGFYARVSLASVTFRCLFTAWETLWEM